MKKKFFLGILFGFSLSLIVAGFTQSHADTFPANAQAEWSKYFSGNVIIPDPEANLTDWFTTPNSHCVDLEKQILNLVIEYGRNAFKSKNSEANKYSGQSLGLLHGLEDSQDVCFDGVARVYLAASLHILEPVNSNVGQMHNNDRIDGRPLARSLELTMLGAAILNHQNQDGSRPIQFLTPKKRAEQAQSVWLQKAAEKGPMSQEYLVSAGFDCEARTILIDPYLPPLNLAGTFVHELDHLFRDRVTVQNPLAAYLSIAAPAKADVLADHLRLTIAMDETLASVMSAYYQRHMRFFHDYKTNGLNDLLGGSSSPLPFRLSNDLTLFRDDKTGPMNEIWSVLQGKPSDPAGGLFNGTANYFLVETFLRGDPYNPNQKYYFAPSDAIQTIYQTIYHGYFGGGAISDSDMKLLDPSLHGLSNDPLSHFLNDSLVNQESELNYGYELTSREMPPDSWVKEVANARMQQIVVYKGAVVHLVYNLANLFDHLDQTFPQLFDGHDPSPYCTNYLKGLEQGETGELSSYVGNELSAGIKLGETGVKPGETGIKPGETGVKPGETGVKPSETGVKPTISAVRPCLNIGRQL